MDERLVGFTDRMRIDTILELGAEQAPYFEALCRVARRFNDSLSLPFEDCVQKPYPGFAQLHLPAEDDVDMIQLGFRWYPKEWAFLYPGEQKLGLWLIDHADEFADRFVGMARRLEFATLYRLELPQGVRGSLWKAPFRLVWTYDIAIDGYVARFDMIGKTPEFDRLMSQGA